jgi:hypothetical protein
MKSSDIPKVQDHLGELDEALRQIRSEVNSLGEILQRIAKTCEDEPELLEVMNRERRYFRALRGMIDDFPIIRQMRRRLPVVEARLRRNEGQQREEDQSVQRQAEDVRNSLEDVLRRFLR